MMKNILYNLTHKSPLEKLKEPKKRKTLREYLPFNKTLIKSAADAELAAAAAEDARTEALDKLSKAKRAQATISSQELAFTLPEGAGATEVERGVRAQMEKAAKAASSPVAVLKAQAEVGEKQIELDQALGLAAKELGRKEAFQEHQETRNAALSLGARFALLPLTAVEMGIMHPYVKNYLDDKDYFESSTSTWIATGVLVVLANFLLLLTVKLGASYLESVRISRLTDTEPPAKNKLIATQGATIAAALFQVVLIYLRFGTDSGEVVDDTGMLVSLLVLLGVYLVAAVDFVSCPLSPMWDDKVLVRVQRLWKELHFELIPHYTYLKQLDDDRQLNAMQGVLVTLDHRYADAGRSIIGAFERTPDYEPPTAIAWPQPAAPKTGYWSEDESKSRDAVIRLPKAG